SGVEAGMSIGPQTGIGDAPETMPVTVPKPAKNLPPAGVRRHEAALAIVSPDDSAPDLPAGGLRRLIRRGIQRALDIVMSLAGLLAVAPLMAMLAAIIRADTSGPVIYRQVR